MFTIKNYTLAVILCFVTMLCRGSWANAQKPAAMDVIFDSDANNELDDQHAIAYLLMNPGTFNVLGITTNATHNGGPVAEHSKEAGRVIALVGKYGEGVKVYDGAQAEYEEILPTVSRGEFDGSEAVNFIIRSAEKYSPEHKLTVLAVGKLTNLALAFAKAPGITGNIRLVWLGSNYPEKGEYNLMDDIPSMNAVLDSDVEFEIVTVRYKRPDGTAAVRVTREEALEKFSGKGPRVAPVEGRHGGEFTCFGDYSADLFKHIKVHDNGRALYDMAAVAVVKNPVWGTMQTIPAPTMVGGLWVERPENPRTIGIWGDFDRDAIVADFEKTLELQ